MSLIVEDGTGSATAESYLSVADADTYHAAYGEAGWTGTDEEKEQALRAATRALDARFSARWRGYRKTGTQALDWPRQSVSDDDGYYLDADALPQALKDATAILALKHREGVTLMPDGAAGSNVTSESIAVAGAVSKSVQYAGVKAPGKLFHLVDHLLTQLVESGARMYRG